MNFDFWTTAGMSAFLGACLTGILGIAKDYFARAEEKKSLKKGILAEIQSIDHGMRVRRYRTHLQSFAREMKNNNIEKKTINAYMGEGFNPVFKANIQKIGMLGEEFCADIV